MLRARLELARLSAWASKTHVATNYTISAKFQNQINKIEFSELSKICLAERKLLSKKCKSNNVKNLLSQHGVLVLPNALNVSKLKNIATAADSCFTNIENLIQQYGANRVKDYLPTKYVYLERSTSLSPVALDDFQTAPENIFDIFADSLAMPLLIEMLGAEIVCNLTRSRVAKQYALENYHALHTANSWHQDGALGVPFPARESLESNQFFDAQMTEMLICWIPLVDCLGDCPCMQLIKKPLKQLLHFDSLNDNELGKIFEPKDFWVPKLNFGDMLIFLNGTLHKTFVTEAMKKNRTSIELRFMNPAKIPDWMQNDNFANIT
jgi:hypothetical protein